MSVGDGPRGLGLRSAFPLLGFVKTNFGLANRGQVLIELLPVARAEAMFDASGAIARQIENACDPAASHLAVAAFSCASPSRNMRENTTEG